MTNLSRCCCLVCCPFGTVIYGLHHVLQPLCGPSPDSWAGMTVVQWSDPTSEPIPAVCQLRFGLHDAHGLSKEVLMLLQSGGGLGAGDAHPLASTTGLRSTTTPTSSFGTTQAASAREPGQVSIDSASGDAGVLLDTPTDGPWQHSSLPRPVLPEVVWLARCQLSGSQGRAAASANISILISTHPIQGLNLH